MYSVFQGDDGYSFSAIYQFNCIQNESRLLRTHIWAIWQFKSHILTIMKWSHDSKSQDGPNAGTKKRDTN